MLKIQRRCSLPLWGTKEPPTTVPTRLGTTINHEPPEAYEMSSECHDVIHRRSYQQPTILIQSVSSRSMEKQVFGFTFHSLMLVKGEHSLVLVKGEGYFS
ncbi:hypothetical protein F2Q69_00005479 [Brassica cretica]|uniref:Uncharacterized protein n=1 Tax=Brassica cretica TaxID=69181 RepID=A0A8S9P119_BRACR|nr:hypothetical protein F2Q69_00005479 [Brassica cretica]